MIAVLLYLLIKEQAAHAETRRIADQDRREFSMKYSEMAGKSLVAIAAVDDTLRDIREVMDAIRRLTPGWKP